MIKQITINCNFRNTVTPVTFYIGDPSDENHPINFQAKWLTEKRGGTVPKAILDSLGELQKIAIRNRVSFQELCEFAIQEIQEINAITEDRMNMHKKMVAAAKKDKKDEEN